MPDFVGWMQDDDIASGQSTFDFGIPVRWFDRVRLRIAQPGRRQFDKQTRNRRRETRILNRTLIESSEVDATTIRASIRNPSPRCFALTGRVDEIGNHVDAFFFHAQRRNFQRTPMARPVERLPRVDFDPPQCSI